MTVSASADLLAESLVGADLDDDGDDDLAISSAAGVTLFWNNGAGEFVETSVEGERFTNLDGGRPRRRRGPRILAGILVVNKDQVVVFRNLAGTSFEEPNYLGFSGHVTDLTAGDLTGDGKPELVAVSFEEILVAENLTASRSADVNQDGVPDECEGLPHAPFQRGDTNGDARRNLSDVVSIIGHLFLATGPFACEKAADTNDDGTDQPGRCDFAPAAALRRAAESSPATFGNAVPIRPPTRSGARRLAPCVR